MSLKYLYDLQYGSDGDASLVQSQEGWITWDGRRPDGVWMPDRVTAVSGWWHSQLAFDTVSTIIPLGQ